ncbi:MAG: hypothetical protein KJ645_06215, partial [Planctomycetes bacterium]|nr:hypothetical protein [Planctomycetota bacterium]
MFSRVKTVFQDFLRLPLGFRVASIGVAASGCLGLVMAFSSGWKALLPILGILLVVGVLFYLVGLLARILAKKKGKGMGASLWNLTDRKKSSKTEYLNKAEADAAKKLRQRWKDVYQLLSEKGYDFYSLPWYLIIGPSQSGKTTLIQKSNQEFPIGDKPVSDFGTKNCNWFFTNKAILIDTAGRYVEHHGEEEGSLEGAEDRAEWEDFLKLLMRYRKRSPINGIILTVKIPDILAQDALQRERTAEILRKALLDIEERLKIQCPVYIMVSMCDLIPGFFEFFSLLPGLSDRSLLGWSSSGRFDQPLDPADMKQGLGELTGLLKKLRLNFLNEKAGLVANEPDEARGLDKLYAFPDEFEAMLEPLQSMLKKAFDPSAYYQGHFLRGIFFTSALQKGEPVLGACLNLLGTNALSPQGRDAETSKTSKAFFIADFFEEKVFAEKGLVKLPTRASKEKRLKERFTLIAGAVVLLGALGWVSLRGFDLHRKAVGVTQALQEVQNVVNEGVGGDATYPEDLPYKLKELHHDLTLLKEDRAWINAGNVNETVDMGSYTVAQTFIYRCFRPALAEYLSGDRRATQWEEGLTTFRILAALHRLSLGSPGTEVSGSDHSWIDDFEQVISGLDGTKAPGANRLSDQLPVDLTVIEDNEACRQYLSSILTNEICRVRIWNCLRDWVLDPWAEMLRGLDEDPERSQQVWVDTNLNRNIPRAWILDRYYSVEKRFEGVLIELRQILSGLSKSDNWKSVEAYQRKIRKPWNLQYEKIQALLLSAESLAGAHPFLKDPEPALSERLHWFRELKAELMITQPPRGMSEAGDRAWKHISKSLTELETKIARKNDSIRGWLKTGSQSNHSLFLVKDQEQAGGEGQQTSSGKSLHVQDLKRFR